MNMILLSEQPIKSKPEEFDGCDKEQNITPKLESGIRMNCKFTAEVHLTDLCA